MTAPVSTTVIALDIAAGASGSDASPAFERLLAAARQAGFTTHDQATLSLATTLAPEVAVGGALRQLAAAKAEIESQYAPLSVRGVVHYGVVFRAESGGQVSYMGSAVRSAQSTLRRAPAAGGLMATREFVAYATGLGAKEFSFAPQDGATADGLSAISVGAASAAPRKPADQLSSSDVELLQFLKKRLATDLGPFAGTLVDTARNASSTASQLIAALAREIDSGAARQRFEADAQAHVDARFGIPPGGRK